MSTLNFSSFIFIFSQLHNIQIEYINVRGRLSDVIGGPTEMVKVLICEFETFDMF